MFGHLITLAQLGGIAQAAYVWPSKYDRLDDLLYLQGGYIRNGELSDQVRTCDFGAGAPGIQKSAEWLRTAFHDAATHDTATKLGGLDASIQFELDRAENKGAALNNTLADISSSYNIRDSASDLLALAMVMAVERCGDLVVPLRFGRVDATKEGIAGVPEAHTDLETAQKRFQTMGFSQEEMITLVACGHTIGGVHSVDHPEIVTEGGVSEENVARFDTTTGNFDNAVVNEFLNNTTKNPLVGAKNDTLNSDKRIFTSDKNETMTKLSDPAYFKSQCESLLERMINTVPGNVQLTEPYQPADIRPTISSYQFRGDKVELSGRVRVRTTESTGRNASDLEVSLLPKNSTQTISTTMATFKGGSSSGYNREIFNWYEFNSTLDAGATTAFDIQLKTRSTGEVVKNDNAGTGGFPLNADIFWQREASCLAFDETTQTRRFSVIAAIREQVADNAAPQIVVVQRETMLGSHMPRLIQETVEMKRTEKAVGGYVFYQADATLRDQSVSGTMFDIVVGESKLEFLETNDVASNAC
ncbi:hypothetical protein CKM354_000619600 [Cercospora kikuchii]|uniref:Peroxidase n=1 Tax=Cercospora kikuchii TaxID=84275 RepID=A0A9P3CHF7_9PEZI|nr:uncharacterized protein CKM354_000619600 [Cercospora kikuchii]GIZ42949.1 hypothetical protein CKM354_000619600 [Cercospora kikuchii]